MFDIYVTEDILERVSVRLEMTSRDWLKLKTSGVWKQVEQILLESETGNTHCCHQNLTGRPGVEYCKCQNRKTLFSRFADMWKTH